MLARVMTLPPPLFVVGTDTEIGKTVASACVVRALDARYWKPVQTGDDSDTDTVTRLAGPLADGTPRAIADPAFHFALPASPHTAAKAEKRAVDPAALRTALARHVEDAAPSRLVAELAGGLMVPLTDEWMQADWIAEAKPEVVLVARTALGTLNHTLLTLEALRRRGIEPRALVLSGERHEANRATLAQHLSPVFELTPLAPLSTERIDGWLAENDLGGALR